jgi:hypothetical protein
MKLLIIFIVFNILNVVIQTVKSIATIKCGKTMAAVINAVAYGLYTYIVILMVCELPLWSKCLIVGLCNLVGVYAVKWFEEKARKDKLWKVECTIPTEYTTAVDFDLKSIPHSYITISTKHTLFNFYCATQSETQKVMDITKQYNAKYFVSESKIS